MFYAFSIQAMFCLSVLTCTFNCASQAGLKFDYERITMNQSNKISYNIEELTYLNESANITLAGTLTKPTGSGPFPAVILIVGMGATNRDGMMYGHQLYKVIAEHLTQQGIAVLRFDKRGVGKSSGLFSMDITSRDLADDVLAGIDYLKTRFDVDHKKIGLVGHSEGGFIASLLATQSLDISFVVSMAGAVASDPVILGEQTAVQLKMDGASEKLINMMREITKKMLIIVQNEQDRELAAQKLDQLTSSFLQELSVELKEEASKYHFALNPVNQVMKCQIFNSPWYRWFLAQDMHDMLSRIHVPLLAIYGERDFMAPSLMVPIINQAMQIAGNQDYTVLELPGLNHAFQTCATGSLAEYASIQETVAPIVLKTISDWLLKRTF